MKTRNLLLGALSLCLLISTGLALPGKPNFMPALYADGEVWGTKAAALLPPPNGRNTHSFDKLFVIVNGAPGQLPVGEAAPRNPMYNGGRWFTHTVMWTAEGMAAIPAKPQAITLLDSYRPVRLAADRLEREKLIFRTYDKENVNVQRNI